MVDDNVVTRHRRWKRGGAIYSVVLDEELDRRFLAAAKALGGSPEGVFARALSEFLSSYEACMNEALEKLEIKH